MTESNKTYRKSSRNTAVAVGLGGAAILASGFLVLQVNSLDQRYGRIEESIGYYTGELQSAQQQLALAREQYRELSDQNQNLTQEVASAESSRQSAAQRQADAQARLEASQAELTAVQYRLAEAQETIADAQRIERETAQALQRRNGLETELVDLEGEVQALGERQQALSAGVDQTQSAVDRLEERRGELQREADRLAPAVEDLRAQQRLVEQLQDEQDRLEQNRDDLNASIASARTELATSEERADAAEGRISDPKLADLPRRVAVWTPHAMRRIDLEDAVQGAAQLLHQIQSLAQTEVLRNGLIMTPARGAATEKSAAHGRASATAIAIGPAGEDLSKGFQAVRDFIRSELYEVAT